MRLKRAGTPGLGVPSLPGNCRGRRRAPSLSAGTLVAVGRAGSRRAPPVLGLRLGAGGLLGATAREQDARGGTGGGKGLGNPKRQRGQSPCCSLRSHQGWLAASLPSQTASPPPAASATSSAPSRGASSPLPTSPAAAAPSRG